jgi:hypothetical protein
MQCPAKSEVLQWYHSSTITSMSARNEDSMQPIRILFEDIKKFDFDGFIQDFSNSNSFPAIRNMIVKKQLLKKCQYSLDERKV